MHIHMDARFSMASCHLVHALLTQVKQKHVEQVLSRLMATTLDRVDILHECNDTWYTLLHPSFYQAHVHFHCFAINLMSNWNQEQCMYLNMTYVQFVCNIVTSIELSYTAVAVFISHATFPRLVIVIITCQNIFVWFLYFGEECALICRCGVKVCRQVLINFVGHNDELFSSHVHAGD